VSGADTGFALGTQAIGSAVVLNLLLWLALVAFAVIHGFHAPTGGPGHQSGSGSILVFVAAGVGVVLLGTFGGLFYLLTRGKHRAKELIRRISARVRFLDPDRTAALVERLAERFAVLMEDRRLLFRALGWATANWLLDAASLWVFVAAFDHFFSPIDVLVAYGLANVLAAIPITPGGLGVVEFVLVSMITAFGPTSAQALSGVLAYRAVNFWLPIPVGGMAYGSLELERGAVYRRLHLFFFHRYQSRRGETRDEAQAPDDAEARPVTGSRNGAPQGRISGTVVATNGAHRAPDVPGAPPLGRPRGNSGPGRGEGGSDRGLGPAGDLGG
jgi:hypothetical protein